MTQTVGGAANMLRARPSRERGRKSSGKGKRSPLARKVAVFLLVALIAAAGLAGWLADPASGKISAGVTVNSFAVGGLTPEEAKAALLARTSALALTFKGPNFNTIITPAVASRGRQALADFDIEAAVQQAYSVGRRDNVLASAAERLNAYLFGSSVDLAIKLDRGALRDELLSRLGGLAQKARDARLDIRLDPKGGSTVVTVIPEREGRTIDLEAIARESEQRLYAMSAAPVEVDLIKDPPDLTAAQVDPLRDEVSAALARAPLTVRSGEKTWTVTDAMLVGWLAAIPAPGGRARLGLNETVVRRYLETLAPELRVSAKDAVFQMTDGRVTKFEPSVDGQQLDVESSLAAIDAAVFTAETPADIELVLRLAPPKVSTADSNPYGIREIVGVGESNFKGSPKNRRINIGVGAKSLDGTLIQPNEEFSLLKTLGAIDEAHGYLKELVIKQDKTVPEFGGGLCQIGTTTFRAVLAAGLPVKERQNHSYRVVYYERDGAGKYMGPGKDATIYDPRPDFKFLNDTGNVLLLKTAISGDRLTFTLWGAKDGRKAEQTDSKVFNVVPPPEKKIIETTDLKPGETKCTESPHPGADAVFTYTVTYPNGDIKKQDFKSHYRPWGEVCLIGIDPSAKAAEGTDLPSADVAGAAGQ